MAVVTSRRSPFAFTWTSRLDERFVSGGLPELPFCTLACPVFEAHFPSRSESTTTTSPTSMNWPPLV
jgi:hypothetical protein